ncbi:hypothetical protein J9874_04051 (plasmid) [Duffyella gerundensis]|jgi:hypothetical protein|uniref:helix-turn-helix domain-containing protein n=1 Tax=Erwiniaceae TaxID=1903409 RepID=UPI001654462A|nr:helix-turn-helix transcriptional regulator [Duffyella gerundensis]UCB33468.1 hypothetical protein J9874_04051 [Duffyella gerundensis]
MLDTIGKRLKCCRAATGTSPQEVVAYVHEKKMDLSYTSYTRWEAGSAFPTKKIEVLKIVADFFNKNGLRVETNWILTGEGFPPQFTEYTTLDEDTLFILASRQIPDVELIQIGGVYGEPYVNFGEFCIVSNERTIDPNNGKLCYIRHADGIKIGVVLVLDEDTVQIQGKEITIIKKEKIVECRRIKWIQKK